jgi:hypothetical protein
MNDAEMPEYEKSYTFSSLDKLTWTDRIEQQMWICVRTRGFYGSYDMEVRRLEDCVKTNFYGLDLATPIEDNIMELDYKKKEQTNIFIKNRENGIYYHPESFDDLNFRDKDLLKKQIYDWYWNKRFEFVRDLLAKHRGLLWGKRKIAGGDQMEFDDAGH